MTATRDGEGAMTSQGQNDTSRMAPNAPGWFVFAWRRGEKPRLIGPFADEYAANRRLWQLEPAGDLYAWSIQPEEPK